MTITRQISLAVVLGLAALCAQADEIRIGFINTDRIFKEANTAKQAKPSLSKNSPSAKKIWSMLRNLLNQQLKSLSVKRQLCLTRNA